MYRKLLKDLEKWREKQYRRPLLIRGARQVGKTWLVREFGKQFEGFVEINLEANPQLHRHFESYFGNPKRLIETLSTVKDKSIIPGRTLLFLDEIQVSKEALLSLRYFKELLPDLHVIAAGSLLEFTIREISFPVGRIEFAYLFPLNFEEFLLAGNKNEALEDIKSHSIQDPLSPFLHELFLEEVANYILLGGMPEVVKAFQETKDFRGCQEIQQVIAATFREDFYKYASKAVAEHVKKVFDAIPKILGSKFKFSSVDPSLKSRELSKGLSLLCEAGIAYKIHHSSGVGIPLSAQTRANRFKVFSLDIGLCQRLLGRELHRVFEDEKQAFVFNQGALCEQFVAQELISYTPSNQRPTLHYWHREKRSSRAEVDFLIEREQKVLPIEVKSGKTGALRSLQLFLKEKKRTSPRGVRISSQPFHFGHAIESIPFYAIRALWQNTSID